MKRLALLLALPLLLSAAPPRETATFAGGCFWCMEGPFDSLPGVLSVTAGYAGGKVNRPTYEQVSAGGTGHRESVQIVFDPTMITYARLLDIFWHNIDPLDNDGQFCDKGSQYRSAIFYHDATQKKLAEESKVAVEKKLGRAYTDILSASEFWRAEEYHQHYYKKNPVRYHFYRFNCGRDQRLAAVWGSAPAH
ncbi:MAG TPA: peptide-methionine (S)-S-oxide reductase MsrA [Thermoanaerobaculia bacterium]|nr:peptide-methionine (S)-S-oxide reductase MsrA [Thermoanaerobaculia bacterium]